MSETSSTGLAKSSHGGYSSLMIQANVTEVKNRFSHYLRLVKKGECVQILERAVPVARIESLAGRAPATGAELKRLVEEGIVTPPRRGRAALFLKRPLVRCKADPVDALIEERGSR